MTQFRNEQPQGYLSLCNLGLWSPGLTITPILMQVGSVVEADKSNIEIAWPLSDVMCTTLRGHVTVAMAMEHMSAAVRAYNRRTRVHHYFDCDAMTGYDSAARIQLTEFALRHRAQVASSTFLVRSKIVAMGVSTAALAARLVGLEFVMVSDRKSFDGKRNERIRAR